MLARAGRKVVAMETDDQRGPPQRPGKAITISHRAEVSMKDVVTAGVAAEAGEAVQPGETGGLVSVEASVQNLPGEAGSSKRTMDQARKGGGETPPIGD